MIRLFTLGGGGEAYLNFMGNEFVHPEWIDFPREGNGWSFHYCRRQWSLRDNGYLKYQWLGEFDEDMIKLAKRKDLLSQRFGDLRYISKEYQVIAFYRKGLLFAFNFNPTKSFTDICVPIPNNADYTVEFSTDDKKYGGQDLIRHIDYPAKGAPGERYIELYLPSRTAVVLKEGRIRKDR
jgi:1,4-alpha-glucan branching enzyme